MRYGSFLWSAHHDHDVITAFRGALSEVSLAARLARRLSQSLARKSRESSAVCLSVVVVMSYR